MNINLSQSLELKQTLRLSQVMLQRFQVLQQSNEEFQDTIQHEVKKNPFLSVRFMDKERQAPSYLSDQDYVTPLDFATYNESLLSVLTNQLDSQFLSEIDYNTVLMLIDEVDDQGFIKNYKDIRAEIMGKYGISERDVFRCLKILHSFEPEGIGARSINECLWIQIDNYDLDDNRDRDNLKLIVKNHLEDVSEKKYEAIITVLSITEEQIKSYIDFISHLNPTPAAQYMSNQNIKIQPSIRVDVEDGVLSLINLEEERMILTLNPDMLKKLTSDNSPELKKQFNDAKIWIEHFKKRQDLIRYCGEYLMKKQRLFFLEGSEFLLPCLQRDMALALGVSESTISRLVRSKYIDCKHGVILIQQLCKRNIYGKTSRQVKVLVKYYCEQYPGLSDEKIGQILKGIGLPIARRTVTKYRHEVNVESSYIRKTNKPPSK